MKKHIDYLTDNELNCLMQEIEEHDLVFAPPDLQDKIINSVLQNDQSEVFDKEETCSIYKIDRSGQDKILEYRRFRFRVLTAVAATVLAIFFMPKLEGLLQQINDPEKNEIQEYFEEYRYVTKEDALNTGSIMESILGGVNIFANESKLNLFR